MNVLDTDMLTLLMHGQSRVTKCASEEKDLAITIVTRIEVLQGRFATVIKAANGAELLQAQHWLAENERYMQPLPMIEFDRMAAQHFDRLKLDKGLKKIGRPDLLIGCMVLACQATVVTRNVKHFRLIPGLKVENWAD